MAEEHQGEVIIGVDIDSKGFEKGSGDIEKAMKSLENTLAKAVSDMSNSISQTLTAALKQVDQQVQSTEKAVSKAGSGGNTPKTGGKAKYTEEYKELEAFVKQQENNLQKLKEEQKQLNDLQIPENKQYPYEFKEKENPLGTAGDYKTLAEQIKDYEDTIRNCNEELAELEATGRKFAVTLSQELKDAAAEVSGMDFTPLDLSQYDDSVKKYAVNVNKANLAYAQQENQLKQLEAQLAMLSQKEQTPEVVQKSGEIQNKIEALKIKLQELGQRAEEAKRALEQAVSSSGSAQESEIGDSMSVSEASVGSFLGKILGLGKTGSKVVGMIAKGFGGVGRAISKAASKLNVFNRGQKTAEELAKKMTRQLTRIFTMLKSRIVRSFVTSLFTGISEGIQGIAKIDSEFNKVISTLKSRFSQLKFSIVSALSPIISYIAPALDRAMQYLSSLADKAGQLIAALTGQSSYKKAIYNYKDYAKSLDKNKDKTDKLTDSTKKLNKQLASFDELNILSQIDEDEDEKETDELVYANVPVSFEISDLSDRIKAAFAKGDFEQLGKELAERLNKSIDSINSADLGNRIARIINSAVTFGVGLIGTLNFEELTLKVTDFLNTLIDEVDPIKLGELVSALLNAVITIAFTFGTNFPFIEFGEKLGKCVETIIETTEWEKAGEALNTIIIGLLDSTIAFLDEIDPDNVEDSIGKLVKGIDLGGIAVRLGKILWRVLKLAWAVLKGLWNTSGIADWWKEQGEKWGKSLSESFQKNGTDKISEDIEQLCNDVVAFLNDVFSDDLEKASKSLVNVIIDVLNLLIGTVELLLKAMVTGVIPTLLESVGASVSSAINEITGGIGALSPLLSQFGDMVGNAFTGATAFEASVLRSYEINLPRIPRLATGTVIPANYGEFAAILGDNKRDPEIVSPIPAMKQAFLEALAESGMIGSSGDIVIEIDGREVFRAVKKENDTQKRRHGGVSLLA